MPEIRAYLLSTERASALLERAKRRRKEGEQRCAAPTFRPPYPRGMCDLLGYRSVVTSQVHVCQESHPTDLYKANSIGVYLVVSRSVFPHVSVQDIVDDGVHSNLHRNLYLVLPVAAKGTHCKSLEGRAVVVKQAENRTFMIARAQKVQPFHAVTHVSGRQKLGLCVVARKVENSLFVVQEQS